MSNDDTLIAQLQSRNAALTTERDACRDESRRLATELADSQVAAEYDRGILAPMEAMFEAVGPDLVEAVARAYGSHEECERLRAALVEWREWWTQAHDEAHVRDVRLASICRIDAALAGTPAPRPPRCACGWANDCIVPDPNCESHAERPPRDESAGAIVEDVLCELEALMRMWNSLESDGSCRDVDADGDLREVIARYRRLTAHDAALANPVTRPPRNESVPPPGWMRMCNDWERSAPRVNALAEAWRIYDAEHGYAPAHAPPDHGASLRGLPEGYTVTDMCTNPSHCRCDGEETCAPDCEDRVFYASFSWHHEAASALDAESACHAHHRALCSPVTRSEPTRAEPARLQRAVTVLADTWERWATMPVHDGDSAKRLRIKAGNLRDILAGRNPFGEWAHEQDREAMATALAAEDQPQPACPPLRGETPCPKCGCSNFLIRKRCRECSHDLVEHPDPAIDAEVRNDYADGRAAERPHYSEAAWFRESDDWCTTHDTGLPCGYCAEGMPAAERPRQGGHEVDAFNRDGTMRPAPEAQRAQSEPCVPKRYKVDRWQDYQTHEPGQWNAKWLDNLDHDFDTRAEAVAACIAHAAQRTPAPNIAAAVAELEDIGLPLTERIRRALAHLQGGAK